MPEFWKPSVATDLVAFAKDTEGDIRMLLIERGIEPFKGQWAFPGGFHQEHDEDLEHCAVRELSEETGATVEKDMISLLTVRSAKDRDPRQNRVISVSFMYCHEGHIPVVQGGDDARIAVWHRIQILDPDTLAFDHKEIYRSALERFRDSRDSEFLDFAHWYEVREQLGEHFDTLFPGT